jgi:hypothetical protein
MIYGQKYSAVSDKARREKDFGPRTAAASNYLAKPQH